LEEVEVDVIDIDSFLNINKVDFIKIDIEGYESKCISTIKKNNKPKYITTEIDKNTPYPVIDLLPGQRDIMARSNYGATMRLGAYPAVLKSKSIVHSAYHTSDGEFISERHRHRYEVNPDYIGKFEADGLVFSGMSPDHKLMEIAELPKSRHPFFVATQFHPEFKSRPLDPHPLFLTFVKSAMKL
ncbi:hypothetical protein LCGC14_2172190, partial [marine sediment metagenome]